MANSNVELDLFGLHHHNNPSNSVPPPRPRLDRRQSFNGISKINPEIVKSVIASANKHGTPPVRNNTHLPVFQPLPFPRASGNEKEEETAPMTIFYNGRVSVFDLPKHEAESVMKLAMEKDVSMNDGQITDHTSSNSETIDHILGSLNDGDADIPIKRKKSLQRFFEKRKERLTSVSPYYIIEEHVTHIHKQKT